MRNNLVSEVFGNPNTSKPINSKRKGSNAERVAVKCLSTWTGYEFNRTPMSGGLSWQKAQKVCGDVVAQEGVYFPFSVEVKSRKNFSIDVNPDKFLRKNSIIYKFYEQSLKDSEKVKKAPIVLCRYNGMSKTSWYFVCNDIVGNILKNIFKLDEVAIGVFKDKYIYVFQSLLVFQINFKDFINIYENSVR